MMGLRRPVTQSSRFEVRLPLYEKQRDAKKPVQLSTLARASKAERVLVVDDEEHVRAPSHDAFEAAGYTVVTF